jgi:hypothetical protein
VIFGPRVKPSGGCLGDTLERDPRSPIRSRRGSRLARLVAMVFATTPLSTGTHLCAAPIDPSTGGSESPIRIEWMPEPAAARLAKVRVSGLTSREVAALQRLAPNAPEWKRFLSVEVESAGLNFDPTAPKMEGQYLVDHGLLQFEPAFPLEAGLRYRARFAPGELANFTRGIQEGPGRSAPPAAVDSVFTIPVTRPPQATVVRQVYPSARQVPENLLKFYIHFSAPMSRGQIYEHIHLRDANHRDVELPFLELDQELWDPSMTRLTLFIDPGRIKRGVKPLEEIGPALEAGRSYSLEIDPDWRDGNGHPLQQPFRKEFEVIAPDRDPLDPRRWVVRAPSAETRDPLFLEFNKFMDNALARRLIRVIGPAGKTLDGAVDLANEERSWRFVPTSPWKGGNYRVEVDPIIEDLAGNNIGKAFEVDLLDISKQTSLHATQMPFEVK